MLFLHGFPENWGLLLIHFPFLLIYNCTYGAVIAFVKCFLHIVFLLAD